MSHTRRPAWLLLPLPVLAVLAATACTSPQESAPAGPAATEGGAAEGGASAAPVVVTADNGEVTLSEVPDAIVSLSASHTEILFAIGAGEQVIAVDSASDYPEDTPITDLSGFRPNVEAIAALEPDLVLLARDSDGVVDALENAGIPVLLLETPSGIEEIYGQIETIGRATRHVQVADDLLSDLQHDIDGLLASVPERAEPVRYFYELSGEYHSLTSDTFVGSVMQAAGLASIADGIDRGAGGFPQLSAEYVLDADPDLVFVAHTDGSVPTVEEIAGRAGWADLTAVQEGNVVMLDADIASRWGPRVVELVIAVVEASSVVDAG